MHTYAFYTEKRSSGNIIYPYMTSMKFNDPLSIPHKKPTDQHLLRAGVW